MTQQGHIHLDTFLTMDLRNCSKQRLLSFCLAAWNEDLLSNYSDRKAWQNLHPIDQRATVQVLQKFGDTDRIILVNEIAGAYQTCNQKAKWDPNCPTTCPHCTQEDSREHRLYHCPAFAEARRPYEEVLQFYQTHGMEIHELAVILLSPDDMMRRTLQFQQPTPTWLDKLTDAFLMRVSQGTEQHYYTDGSCQFPTLIQCRFASYSIVADLCESEQERIHAVSIALPDGDRPTLQTLATCRCQGEQHIHRAELQAIVELCQALPPGTIHTDSQVALTAAVRCTKEPLISLHNLDNFDLLGRLWHTLQVKRFQFCKVSAHRDFHLTVDRSEAYHQMGNQVANDRAIWACWYLQAELTKTWARQCSWVLEQQQFLEKLLRLHLHLFVARTQLAQVHHQEQLHDRRTGSQDIVALFGTWSIATPWTIPRPHVDCTGQSIWGSFLAIKFKEWYSQICWASSHAGADDYGVTWYELSISFMLHLGGYLPIKMSTSDGAEQLMVCHTYADALAKGVKMADFCTNFIQMYLQMADLTKPSMMPAIDRGLVRSLYLLGAGFQASGYRKRPSFPKQSLVCHILKRELAHHRGTKLELFDLPFPNPISWTPTIIQSFSGAWHGRTLRAQRAMRNLRATNVDGIVSLSFPSFPVA